MMALIMEQMVPLHVNNAKILIASIVQIIMKYVKSVIVPLYYQKKNVNV